MRFFCVVFFYSGKSSYGKKLLASNVKNKNILPLAITEFLPFEIPLALFICKIKRQNYCHINFFQSRRNTIVMVKETIKFQGRDRKPERFLLKISIIKGN